MHLASSGLDPDSITLPTALTLEALRMAYHRRKPSKGLIFYSDRGVQYAAHAYCAQLRGFHMIQSMSRKGDPYDNAVAENFFSRLKCEMVHLYHFTARDQARNVVFAYIDGVYNTFRPHSGIGWLTRRQFALESSASSVA